MTSQFLYTYIRHRDEQELCRMEMRAFFGKDVSGNVLKSDIAVDPSRSPFMQARLEVWLEADSIEQLEEKSSRLDVAPLFKTVCLNDMELSGTSRIGHARRREIERKIGLQITGEPELDDPELLIGIMHIDERWYAGELLYSSSDWHVHQQKPHMYSTALGTRLARTAVNIAVPHPEDIRVIDPCCGIGTVLVEALSMGIPIEGRDINPLVVYGSRKNIAHFGLEGSVTIGPIAEVNEMYDVAIIDMPYNLFTHITAEGQLEILKEARRIAKRCLIITIENMDEMLEIAGFEITDRCLARKGTFSREVILCT
ncbi:RNA methyltransferase [Sporosarcina sp. P37]|uniref:TRM11 family SAM-dependent methyltransferase n=1 Tax=unclassified Sporosarcina TaxID=2647733 RepID=UPI000A17A4B0|nr:MULTISPECIES: RNA methyltransferase [unclassified Sporosarcina]ARK23938.1 RNA methyltransferase [Sporosarcina sp. P37]PID17692.1 RNA methyltransferase [Sporosarcina sp. P35]